MQGWDLSARPGPDCEILVKYIPSMVFNEHTNETVILIITMHLTNGSTSLYIIALQHVIRAAGMLLHGLVRCVGPGLHQKEPGYTDGESATTQSTGLQDAFLVPLSH